MELRKYDLPATNGESILLIPLGDIQWTGRPHEIAEQHLLETIEFGVENDAWFIGLGDYIDFASPSNRQRIASAQLYDNTRGVMVDAAQALTDEVFERFLAPTKGRWLGLLEGHHFYERPDGSTTDQYLAELLDTVHLGWSAAISVKAKDWAAPTVIWASHGSGGGQLPGAQLNKIDKVAQWMEADVYLMGHWTRLGAVPINRIVPDFKSMELRHDTKYLVGCGGYSKGYLEGHRDGLVPRGTYVETGLLRPTTLGSPAVYCGDGGVVSVEV